MIAILKGPGGLEATLDQNGRYWIGRSPNNTVFVNGPAFDSAQPIAEQHRSVSGNHLHILVETDSIRLIDMNSTLGSSLNGDNFSTKSITKPGTYDLKLGNVEFELRCEPYTSQD